MENEVWRVREEHMGDLVFGIIEVLSGLCEFAMVVRDDGGITWPTPLPEQPIPREPIFLQPGGVNR